MKQSKSTTKTAYYSNKAMAEKLIEGYEDFIEEQRKKVNLRVITDLECERSITDYEDQLFYYDFAVWEYELREALRDFKAARKDFATYDKAGEIIGEISRARPKKKVSYKISEGMSKAQREVAEMAYSYLVTISKQVPVHSLNKRKFPLQPPETLESTQA